MSSTLFPTGLQLPFDKRSHGGTRKIAHLSSPAQFRMSAIGFACCVMASLTGTAVAAPITFSQIPAGSGGREPAPNVIITVDDSGSMDWDVSTDSSTITVGKKITLLKNSLIAEFGDGTANSGKIPDGRIRLAWQAMHNNGNASGAGSLTPGNTNAMRPFTGTHRANFNTFINSLKASGGTPSLDMMKNVYSYMRTPQGINSPWADNPGTAQTTPYLACRRSYHIFMTDGAWNSQSDTDRVSNGDSKTQTLGDGTTSYDITTSQVKVYKDSYGDTNSNKASTLSDFAFRNWATDMQDGTGSTQSMANSVRPLIRKAGTETFSTTACTTANNCIALQEFWNPRNDPATWQHVTQHTIGFGLGAVNWPYRKTTTNGTSSTSTAAADIGVRATPADWDYNNSTNDTFGGDLPRLVQGELGWPDVYAYDTSPSATQQDQRTVELWHAAINGRGKYYPAKTAAALTQAFSDILDNVIADTSRPLVSIATSSSYLRSGLNAYIAGYSATKYSGSLSARPIDGTTGAIGGTEVWNAASMLDAITAANLSTRFVLSYGLDPATSTTKGISWTTYSALPTLHQTPLNKNSAGTVDSKGQDRVNYIRGDRTKESANGGAFRDRDSRFGDVVNSNIWYTGKPASGYSENNYAAFRSTGSGGMGGRAAMVYIGANDGMLHGFSAGNWPSTSPTVSGGQELLAYIPQGIAQGSLRNLTDTDYTHRYFVDGSPFTGDAYIDTVNTISTAPAWKTVLVGTLGAGGKGYFILNITDPAQFTASNAANLVITDTTATTDADIGAIFSQPVMDDAVANKSRQIVKMNGGRWAAVLGNGYNSTNEAPVLVVQYLDGAKEIKKLSPCGVPVSSTCSSNFKGNGNGLSSPQLIDLNGDGTVDIAYAGDLKGNVWKFDLTSATDSNWKVSFSGQPFFVTKRSATVTQPITAAPFWMPHPLGGIMLAVGTGENLTDADQSSVSTDSLYSLYDNSTFTVSAAGVITLTDTTPINTTTSTTVPTSLVQQTITVTPLMDSGTNYYTSSNNAVDFAGNPTATPAVAAKRGWYLDWPVAGQRVLQNVRAFSGQKILIQSMIPKASTSSNAETCSPSATTERSFQTVLNMFTGTPPAVPVFTFADSTTFTPSIAPSVTTVEGNAGDTTLIRTDTKIKLLSSNCPVGQTCAPRDFTPGSFTGLRANWRQIQ